MVLTAADFDAIEAAVWAHPQGVAYLDKIAQMDVLLPGWLERHRRAAQGGAPRWFSTHAQVRLRAEARTPAGSGRAAAYASASGALLGGGVYGGGRVVAAWGTANAYAPLRGVRGYAGLRPVAGSADAAGGIGGVRTGVGCRAVGGTGEAQVKLLQCPTISGAGRLAAVGVQNPTDEEMLMLVNLLTPKRPPC